MSFSASGDLAIDQSLYKLAHFVIGVIGVIGKVSLGRPDHPAANPQCSDGMVKMYTTVGAWESAGRMNLRTAGEVFAGLVFPQLIDDVWMFPPLLVTMLFGAVSNALDVQFIPPRIRDLWQNGIRDRLWNSRLSEWLARRLGAPERSRAVDGNAFRATEAALGIAASDLFAALPTAYRDQLADLPRP